MVMATVRFRFEEKGRGVLDCPETPGGYWAHYSHIETDGFRTLSPGQQVNLAQWDTPGFNQDGYPHRARRILP